MARRLLHLSLHLRNLPSPTPPCLLPSRPYISDMRRSALYDHLLRSLRSEISHRAGSPSPPQSFASFVVDDRPGEQLVRLRRTFSAEDGEGEEEVRVDATMVDGAVAPTRSGADAGPPRLHISVLVEVSKASLPGLALNFECSAWPDALDVERVFPVRRGEPEPAPAQQYMGGQFRELDDEMQSAMRDYLEQRGVNDELATFLHSYVENKEQTELLQWLRNVESYVQK